MPIIILQDVRTINLAAGGFEIQLETLAANILGYRLVVPFVRVLRDAANNLAASPNDIQFDFQTASMLSSPNDSKESGPRFVDVAYPIHLNAGISGITVDGQTFVQTPASGKIPAIENPGGLLIWKATNNAGATRTCVFQIDLICRV